jgi:gluconate 2-dehydrogenase gamma chain
MIDRRKLLMASLVVFGGRNTRAAVAALLGNSEPVREPRSRAAIPPALEAVVAAVAEQIIPTTNTPGAIDAGVPAFIQEVISHWCDETERTAFLKGLQSLDEWCATRFQQGFAACSAAQQSSALAEFERRARPFEQERAAAAPNLSPERAFDARAPFFVMIKDLTVIGYFSSESGATQELRYNPVPGRFNGDVPFSEVGRRWSW